jgi:flagellar motor switch protein FliG
MSPTTRAPRLDSLSGLQKTAILFLALGPDHGAKLMQNLSPEEQEAVTREIALLPPIEQDTVQAVMDEFRKAATAGPSGVRGGDQPARQILEQAVGPAKAKPMLEHIEDSRPESQLKQLKKASPELLAGVLRDEHPQTIALVLAHLEMDQVCAIVKSFDPKLSAEVLYRVARLDGVTPESLVLVEQALAGKADLTLTSRPAASGGPAAVARVLNQTGGDLEKQLMEHLGERDPDVAANVKALMFVFEDLLMIDGKGMQRLLREVESKELALSLKGASDDLKAHVRANMSERAAGALEEEMEMLGPVRVKDVQGAQARIIESVRALEESGEIMISGRGGGDDVIT